MNSKFKLTGVLALSLTVSALAACEDDVTTPNGGNPAALADETAEVVDSVINDFFTNSETLNSLEGLGGFIAGVTGQPSIVPFGAAPAADAWSARKRTIEAFEAMTEQYRARRSGNLYVTNIPSALLGATCIWDTQNLQYVDDPTRTGAPSNGIRFILYTLGTNLLPVEPLDEIGLIDIIDLSSGNTLDVDITAMQNSTTILDLDTGGTFDEQNQTFDVTMTGFVSDGTNQLPFDWDASGTASDFSNGYSITFQGVTVGFTQELMGTTFTSTGTLRDNASGDEIRFVLGFDQVTGDLAAGSGLFFNGTQVAEWTGSNFEFQLVPTDGSPLDQQDVAIIASLMFTLELELLFELQNLFFFAVSVTGTTVGF